MNKLLLIAVLGLAACSTNQQQLADLTKVNAQITQTNADLVKAIAPTVLPPAQAAAAEAATGVIAVGAKIVASDAAGEVKKP